MPGPRPNLNIEFTVSTETDILGGNMNKAKLVLASCLGFGLALPEPHLTKKIESVHVTRGIFCCQPICN